MAISVNYKTTQKLKATTAQSETTRIKNKHLVTSTNVLQKECVIKENQS